MKLADRNLILRWLENRCWNCRKLVENDKINFDDAIAMLRQGPSAVELDFFYKSRVLNETGDIPRGSLRFNLIADKLEKEMVGVSYDYANYVWFQKFKGKHDLIYYLDFSHVYLKQMRVQKKAIVRYATMR